MIVLFSFLAALATQSSNLIAVKLFDASHPFISSLKAATFTLPLALVATICFNIYFGSGHSSMTYTSLNAIAIGMAIAVGTFAHILLGSGSLSVSEIIGCSMIFGGVILIIISK